MACLWHAWAATYAAVLEVVVMAVAPKDFTRAADPPSFKIDDDVFFGRKKLNAGAAMKFASLTDQVDVESDDTGPEEIAVMLKRMFRLTLRTSSYRRMAVRIDATLGAAAQAMLDDLDPEMRSDSDEEDDRVDADVLDITKLNEVGEWLLGEYGLRPTEPAGPSSGGQGNQDTGTS